MSGTIYVLTPDLADAVGGVKVHYQVVDALNLAGRSAAIVHGQPGFRCNWFANQTEVVDAAEVRLRGNDIVVVPEEWAHHVPELPVGVTKVIFNQNAYTTFLWGRSWQEVRDVYVRGDVDRVVAVSDDNVDYLRHAFPSVASVRIRCMVDSGLFRAGEVKSRTIAYMPRKRAQEADEVLALVGARGVLEGWTVVPIVGRSEQETASIMRRSSIFLAFGHREGFGLPAAEALACGCVVIGFHGFGGSEIGDLPLWVPDGDVVAFARTLEDVMRSWDADSDKWRRLAADGTERIHTQFTPDQFRRSVATAFSDVRLAGGDRVVGEVPMTCWSTGSRWPSVLRYMRSAARVAVKGGS